MNLLLLNTHLDIVVCIHLENILMIPCTIRNQSIIDIYPNCILNYYVDTDIRMHMHAYTGKAIACEKSCNLSVLAITYKERFKKQNAVCFCILISNLYLTMFNI